jgi:Flp pilus assembly protein TadD
VLLVELGSRHAAAGRHLEARQALERALRVRPNDADALVKLAPIYFRLERIEDGVAALHRALVAEPENPAALTTLALHGIGSGDETAARRWMNRVRRQERIPPALVNELSAEFQKRFGRPPW